MCEKNRRPNEIGKQVNVNQTVGTEDQGMTTTERAVRRLRQAGMQLGVVKPYIGKPEDRNII